MTTVKWIVNWFLADCWLLEWSIVFFLSVDKSNVQVMTGRPLNIQLVFQYSSHFLNCKLTSGWKWSIRMFNWCLVISWTTVKQCQNICQIIVEYDKCLNVGQHVTLFWCLAHGVISGQSWQRRLDCQKMKLTELFGSLSLRFTLNHLKNGGRVCQFVWNIF